MINERKVSLVRTCFSYSEELKQKKKQKQKRFAALKNFALVYIRTIHCIHCIVILY